MVTPLAEANPKFEGDWVMVVDKSKGLRGLNSLTQKVTLEGENVKVERTGQNGELAPESYEYTYLTNGEEHHVVGPVSFPRDVTAEWKGKKLVVEWEMQNSGVSVSAKETWKTRKGGLEIKRTFNSPAGNFVQKLYFVRP
jgi:hypothetical protein